MRISLFLAAIYAVVAAFFFLGFFFLRSTALTPAFQTIMNAIIYAHTIGMLFVITFVVRHDLHVL